MAYTSEVGGSAEAQRASARDRVASGVCLRASEARWLCRDALFGRQSSVQKESALRLRLCVASQTKAFRRGRQVWSASGVVQVRLQG